MYEDTNEAKKLIRSSFSELLEVCSLIKLLSIRNSDKIKSLLDVILVEEKEDPFDNQNIDNETINIISNLLKKGKTVQEISSFLEVNIDIVKSYET